MVQLDAHISSLPAGGAFIPVSDVLPSALPAVCLLLPASRVFVFPVVVDGGDGVLAHVQGGEDVAGAGDVAGRDVSLEIAAHGGCGLGG